MELIDLSKKFREIRCSVERISFADVKLTEQFKREYELYISENRANGYSKVEWADFSTKITTSTGKTIFITNFWFYIAAELSDYLDGLSQLKKVFEHVYEGTDLREAASALRNGISDQDRNRIEMYFSSESYTNDDLECFLSFISDYESWGGGKAIDRNDYYVSPLLQAGNLLAETQGAIAEIAKQMSENRRLKELFSPVFVSKKKKSIEALLSSESLGGFAYLLIDFLIEKKIDGPFWECLIEGKKGLGSFNVEFREFRLTSMFKVSERELDRTDLERGNKLRFFEKPFRVDSRFYYLSNQWTDGTDSRLDIENLKNIFNELYSDYEVKLSEKKYLLIEKEEAKKLIGVIVSKPFLLLAGISGTGKTRFVREQAKTSRQFAETYCLTSVRPDWHEPSDLLGYVSRLNGPAQYITTDVLQFVAKAWRGVASSGLNIEVQDVEGLGERLVVTGDGETLQQVLPYWLCLDEMNLAPVEQYFADYLSVLETREWRWTDDGFTYSSDALLKPAAINEVADKDKLRKALGFGSAEDGEYNDLWGVICQYGLGIPFNLMVAGTVNMDETTHGFSRKVIDRALSFDFGAFFPNDYDDFFTPTSCNKRLSYPIASHASKADLANTFDVDGSQTVKFLSAVNAVLKNTPFELAFRALNELLLAVAGCQPKDDLTLKAVWDDFMMCKVLPRIEGDTDKLTTTDGKALLSELDTVLADQLASIWQTDKDDEAKKRPDLYREKVVADGAKDDEKLLYIPCRSKAKLKWMSDRLTSATFTSFWP